MYEDLIKALRFCGAGKEPCSNCPFWQKLDPVDCQTQIMLRAADVLDRIDGAPETLQDPCYVTGYMQALQDVLDVFGYIQDDLKRHSRKQNQRTYTAIVQCMLDNRAALRESRKAFVRCNDKVSSGFEVWEGK